jgi:ATP-binding cassette subfamily B protein
MNLLIGLIPYDSGEILYNNQKFINFKNEDWYKKISYVPQRITLLNNTIRENITFSFENDIDEERYTNIMKKVNLYDEFINRENEIVSELSDNISGGQAQRIGLARALYRDSKIIFLDEPTSNLDEKNESDFLELVSNLRQNRMIIMISHKNHKNITFDDIIEL